MSFGRRLHGANPKLNVFPSLSMSPLRCKRNYKSGEIEALNDLMLRPFMAEGGLIRSERFLVQLRNEGRTCENGCCNPEFDLMRTECYRASAQNCENETQ